MAKLIKIDAFPVAKSHTRWVILGAFTVLFIGGVVWFIIWWQPWKSAEVSTGETSTSEVTLPSAVEQAYLKVKDGNTAEAYRLIDDEIALQTSQEEKQKLLLEKTTLAYNAADYQTAYDFGLAAENVKPQLELSQILARIAEKLGKIDIAISYWEKSISQMVEENNPWYVDDKQYADEQIARLKGLN